MAHPRLKDDQAESPEPTAAEQEGPQIALIAIPPERGGELWSFVRPGFEAAYSAVDENMPDNFPDQLRERKAILWMAMAPGNRVLAAVLTQLEKRPSGLACRVVASGGEEQVDAIRLLSEKVEAYARVEGCTKMIAQGRLAWAKLMKANGYDFAQAIIEKGLA